MNLLALETTSDTCSVAVANGKKFFEKSALIPQQHAQVLLDWIDELLLEAQLTLKDLDAVCYSAGPGGFTGIRIAAAIVQGIALANNTPIVAISSLQVLAQGIFREYGHQNLVIIQDARMQQVYYGRYELVNDIMSPLCEDKLSSVRDLNLSEDLPQKTWLVTNAAEISDMVTVVSFFNNQLITKFHPHAREVIFLAQNLTKDTDTQHNIYPIYLRSENSWKKLSH